MSHDPPKDNHTGPHPALRVIESAREALAIARGEAEPAAVYRPEGEIWGWAISQNGQEPHPALRRKEALAEITRLGEELDEIDAREAALSELARLGQEWDKA